MLKIDFFESQIGETIVITFPDGGRGIVDAHPPTGNSRPPLTEIIGEQKVHFVCLTHPHADHGQELPPLLREHGGIDSFWHTLSDVQTFIFAIEQTPNFRSEFRATVLELRKKWAECMIDIYGAVTEEEIPDHKLRADLKDHEIAGVRIVILGPEETEQNLVTRQYKEIVEGERKTYVNPNYLSAILALEYGENVVILGGDALKRNWEAAAKRFSKAGLAKAKLLKVPHHGASNALDFRKKKPNYLSLCAANGNCLAVLFAGDRNHPAQKVEQAIKDQCILHCISNGARAAAADPLALNMVGARAVSSAPAICNPTITVEIPQTGTPTCVRGIDCSQCSLGAAS